MKINNNLKEIKKGIYEYNSGNIGKTTTIMVGVHGDEVSGIDALKEILKDIKIGFGVVYFIFANLKAIEKNVRFTEKNLNRCFLKENIGNTYEENRSKEIMEFLNKSDYLLDVHNTTSFNSSYEFLFTTNLEYSKYFDLNIFVTNIDDVQKGGSDGYMDNNGKKGFCIECGSINFGDKNKSEKLAKKSILNFLKATGNIDKTPEIFDNKANVIKMYFLYKVITNGFKFKKDFKDFEEIQSGEIIGFDGNQEIIANQNSIILFPYKNAGIGNEGFCLGSYIKNKKY